MDEWLKMLMTDAPAGSHILRNIDYDTYAKRKAMLGWLNSTVRLVSSPQFNARQFAEALMRELQSAINVHNAEVAHLKFLLTNGTQTLRGHLTKSDAEPNFVGELNKVEEGTLVVNERVTLSPELLGDMTKQGILKAAEVVNAEAEILNLQSFAPPYSRPPYCVTEPVLEYELTKTGQKTQVVGQGSVSQ